MFTSPNVLAATNAKTQADPAVLEQLLANSPLSSASNTPQRAPKAGQLVSREETTAVWKFKELTTESYRIHYRSTDSLGNPSVDSAFFIAPVSPWTGDGPRPVVVVAPGTQGAGPHCDPSVATQEGISIKLGSKDIVAPYESLAMLEHLRRGAAVVMVDYHRNTEGHLEYVDNISAGQTVLDAVKATQELGISPEAPVGIYGYSQGGGAAAAAAERAKVYAPELKIAAVAAGGVPSRLTDVLDAVDGSSLTAVLALATATILDKDPALRDYLYSVELSESTAEVLNTTQNLCAGGLILNYAFTETRDWTKDGSSLIDLINRYPTFIRELERQKIGRLTPEMPVFLYNATNDDIIPVEQAREVRDAWQAGGAPQLTYWEDETPAIPGKIGINHLTSQFMNVGRASNFLWGYLPHGSIVQEIPAPQLP